MSEKDRIREIEQKVAAAKHMSKPNADNALVVRDRTGRWIFEVYLAGHSAYCPNASS